MLERQRRKNAFLSELFLFEFGWSSFNAHEKLNYFVECK